MQQYIRRRVLENQLFARSPRKFPLLPKKGAHSQFAKWKKEQWRNILWTDETKIVLFDGTGNRQYFRRPQNTAYKTQYTQKPVKHAGGNMGLFFLQRSWSDTSIQGYYGQNYLFQDHG